jgi:glyoxylase-like metal-dependent hydrolase (beta-lactamase superfamily II)
MPQANAGYHHLRVGDITVTALNDGTFEASTDYLVGISGDAAAQQLRDSLRPVPPIFTVNAFLIRTGSHLALVDTGAAKLFAPTLGRLPENLAAVAVQPSDIDTVLMTHLHVDHFGGLTDTNDTALFPNATLVVSEIEADFWLSEENAGNAPERARANFAMAQKATTPYRDRMRLVNEGEVLPGISLLALPGHTPGHSGYVISSGGQSLLIWGDIVHVPGIQFARPEVGLAFDLDAAAARVTRERIFDMAAIETMMVAGMHLEFPAFGNVVRNGSTYAFAPAMWRTE